MHCGLSVIQDSPGTSKPNKIQTRIIIHLLKLCIYKCERNKTHVLGLRGGKAERRKRHVAKLPLSFRTLSIYLWFEDLCAWNIQIWEGSKVGDIRRMRYKPTTRVRLDFAESGGQISRNWCVLHRFPGEEYSLWFGLHAKWNIFSFDEIWRSSITCIRSPHLMLRIHCLPWKAQGLEGSWPSSRPRWGTDRCWDHVDSDHKTQGQRKGKGTERYYEMKRMREEYGGSTEGSKGKVEYVLYIELHNYLTCRNTILVYSITN